MDEHPVSKIRLAWLCSTGVAQLASLKATVKRCAAQADQARALGTHSTVVHWTQQQDRAQEEIATLEPEITAALERAPSPELLATQAHARTTDPRTSFDAAVSITKGKLRENQLAVLFALYAYGPAHDYSWMMHYDHVRDTWGWPQQARSGLQTRRKELVDAGYVRDTQQRVTLGTNRRAIVWDLTPAARRRIKELRGG